MPRIRVFNAAGLIPLVLLVSSTLASAEDVVELKTGAKVTGKVIAQDATSVTVERTVGTRTFSRKYPKSQVARITLEERGSTTGSTPAKSATRTKQEVLDLIDSVGKTPPDWFDATQMNLPDTLDLTWPKKAEGPWNSSKNVGQYIWDRINPNPNKWNEGVKLMHHIMANSNGDQELIQRAMQSLGTMYHNLHDDYARAAFWWHQAGLDKDPNKALQPAVHLANCYWKLGNKQLALDHLKKMKSYPLQVIKLLGDMGETDDAIKLADRFAKGGNAIPCYLYGGDVCRVAGRLDDAEKYYRKALDAPDDESRNKDYAKREKARAQASLAAIRFYRLDPKTVKDGTYTASSVGYEDQVQIEVTVKTGRIENVEVTKHREKQFYSSITDTPRNIINAQSVLGIDTTSGATITSEAIINATATALAQGAE